MEGFKLVEIIKISLTSRMFAESYEIKACGVSWKLDLDPVIGVFLMPIDLKKDIFVEMIIEGSKKVPQFDNYYAKGLEVLHTKIRSHLFQERNSKSHRFYKEDLWNMQKEIRFYTK